MAVTDAKTKGAKPPVGLGLTDIYRVCDPASLGFKTTAELPELTEIIGQDRAVSSVQFGMDIRSDGYNIFAMGPMGTGKSSTVFDFLSRQAASLPAPDDWVYVHNFATPHQPNAIRMPAGQGQEFRKYMEKLVEDLQAAITQAFDGEEYEKRKREIAGHPGAERINRQQVDRPRVGAQRHHGIAPSEITGDQRGDFSGNRGRRILDASQAEMFGHPMEQFPPLHKTAADDRARERPAGEATFFAQRGKRLRWQKVRFAQKRGDGLVVAGEHRGCDCENDGRAPDRAGGGARRTLVRAQLVAHLGELLAHDQRILGHVHGLVRRDDLAVHQAHEVRVQRDHAD